MSRFILGDCVQVMSRLRLRPHPFAPFTVHSAREGFALRLAASPLCPPLFAGLSCRHGDAGTENMLTVEDL